jgi:hypothetical protein
MKVYLIEPLAHLLICALWWAGDFLFDRFVAVGRGKQWRDKSLWLWTRKNAKLDDYEPKTARQAVWKENKRNLLNETGEYMGFSPYVTLAERAERQIAGGGERQP